MKLVITVNHAGVIGEIDKFDFSTHQKLTEIVRESAENIKSEASVFAPYGLTGHLGRTVAVRYIRQGMAAFIRPSGTYGHKVGVAVEYGTGDLGVPHTFVSMYDPTNVTPLKHRPPAFPPIHKIAPYAKKYGIKPYVLARAIFRQGGVRARPFTEPAGVREEPNFRRNVQAMLEEQAARFNRG